jgi:hypothetical protein
MPLWGLPSRHQDRQVKAKEATARMYGQVCAGSHSVETSVLGESRFGLIFQPVMTLINYEHQKVNLMQPCRGEGARGNHMRVVSPWVVA